MSLLKVTVLALALCSTAQAFANHDGKGGPCKAYHMACKDDATVKAAGKGKAHHEAMHTCVKNAAAADAANGPACTAAMEKHHDHMEKHHEHMEGKKAEGM